MFRLWCLLIGYFLGSISVAYIVGKVRGIDIREHGSGNAGTTNTLRVLGRRAGAIVLAGDLLKCFVAMIVCWLIFKNRYPEMKYLIRIYAAAGAILGHDYPYYLKFRGGKGVACFVGLAAFFYPGIIPAQTAIFLGIFFLTHYVSLSSIFFGLGFITQIVIFGQFGFFGLTPVQLMELYIVAGSLVILGIFQHRKNIANLLNGIEKKTYLSKKKMPSEMNFEEGASSGNKHEGNKENDKEVSEKNVPREKPDTSTLKMPEVSDDMFEQMKAQADSEVIYEDVSDN